MKRLLISALGIALTLQAGPAFAYKDVGFDPDDRAAVGFDPDIRSTARVVWRDDEGVRWLRIRFTAYEPIGIYWFMKAFLDSRGGSRADYVIELSNADQSGRGCAIHPRGQTDPDLWIRGSFWQINHSARCVVRLSLVRATKRIRWRLRSPSGYVAGSDLAPDNGFYPS